MLKYFQPYRVGDKTLICTHPSPFFVLRQELERYTKECNTCPQWAIKKEK